MHRMETPNAPLPPRAAARGNRGILYQLQAVIAVGLILATLFTAWTPASLRNNPSPISNSGSAVLPASQPQSQSSSSVTSTPRAHPLVGLVAGHWGNDS